MNPGGRWSGLYRVAALEDFDALPLLKGCENSRHVVFAQDTHRMTLDGNYDLPLRERCLLENSTLSGRQAILAGLDPEGCRPEPPAVHRPATQHFNQDNDANDVDSARDNAEQATGEEKSGPTAVPPGSRPGSSADTAPGDGDGLRSGPERPASDSDPEPQPMTLASSETSVLNSPIGWSRKAMDLSRPSLNRL